MSVKIAKFRKLSPTEDYACSVLEIKEWSRGLADLRIEFGTQKSFQLSPRCNQKLKIQGCVVASITIDCQMKPSLFFYPIAISQCSEKARKIFKDTVLVTLKDWLNEKLMNRGTEIIGQEMVIVELRGEKLNTHFLHYL